MPNPSELWRRNHPWAPLYAFGLNRPAIAVPAARLMLGTDLRLLYGAISEIGKLPRGAAVLDVPCGGGVALRGLRRGQGLRYVASDIAEAMLRRTRAESEHRGVDDQVELREADITALPFDDATFDLVASFTGLHCLPDPRAAVDELGRVARPGSRLTGSLVLSDVPLLRKPFVAAARTSGLMGPSASSAELPTWLARAGFVDVELTRSGDMGYFTGVRAP